MGFRLFYEKYDEWGLIGTRLIFCYNGSHASYF